MNWEDGDRLEPRDHTSLRRPAAWLEALAFAAMLALPAGAANATPLPGEASREADTVLNDPARPYQVRLAAELGFVFVLDHTLQFSQDGTKIDYVEEAGQDVLFPFSRLSAEVSSGRHTLVLLYQPLNFETREVLRRDVRIDALTFPEGTAVDFKYGFPFYRASYLFDFARSPDRELAAGVSLQLRDATIEFTSADGTLRRTQRDVGPVPVIKLRARETLRNGFWFGGEVDGFYANVKVLNGSTDTEVEGLIVDGSLRAGLKLARGVDGYLNLRYVGGGARGFSNDENDFGDGFNDNWIHLMSLSLGFILR